MKNPKILTWNKFKTLSNFLKPLIWSKFLPKTPKLHTTEKTIYTYQYVKTRRKFLQKPCLVAKEKKTKKQKKEVKVSCYACSQLKTAEIKESNFSSSSLFFSKKYISRQPNKSLRKFPKTKNTYQKKKRRARSFNG